MSENIKVSVIIPVYNAEKYLRECLDSVVKQTLQEIEVICVDDGSKDGSLDILREYARKDRRIMVLTQQHKYAGVARNYGLSMASGKYVFFMDSDDYCDIKLLKTAISKAQKADADIVVFDNLIPKNSDTFNYHDIPNWIMSAVNPVSWNKIIKKTLLDRYQLHFEALSSTNDITFAALCVACASRIVYLPKPYIYYRTNVENSITSHKKDKLHNITMALTYLYERGKLLPHYEEIMVSIQRFVISNFKFALDHYAGNSDSETVLNFLLEIQKFFTESPLFASISEDKISNKAIWDFYCEFNNGIHSVVNKNNLPQVVVSLTSYPKRIQTVHHALETLISQTFQPDFIILWLAESQFPNRERDLPKALTNLLSDSVQVRWTKDIRSYKKLIPALREFPDAIIITFDDDLLYDKNLLERLIAGYLENPHCIHCHRVTTIEYHGIQDIKTIPDAMKMLPGPNYLYKLSGGAGCLYPPHCMHPDVFREDLFLTLAPTSDDIWFWLMGALNGYKVNVVKNNIPKLTYVQGTQEEALWHDNDKGKNLFFIHLRNVLNYYPILQDVLLHEQNIIDSSANSILDTFLPRKLRCAIQYHKENGMRFTLIRTKYHIKELLKKILPKKILSGIRCLKEHGIVYTFNRLLVHFHLKTDPNETVIATDPFSHNVALSTKPVVPVQVKKNYDYYFNLSPEKYVEELKLWYKRISGIELDLENPKTYNEKIQWLKLYDSTPLKTRLSDKYLVRDWVTEKIGGEYLIPLLGVWDSFDEINFDNLPNDFVLKANHGCGWNIIVRDKGIFDKDDAKSKFLKWMNLNFAFHYGLELQYLNIQPKIIAEEYIENRDQDLYDYKVFCFDGKANSVMFLSERQHGLKMAFYDLQWNKLPFVYSYPQNDKEIPRPKNLDLLIELSEKLSAGFPHVRVDFYILNDGSLKFGEMTFSSASGSCKWNPPEQNRIFGDMIKLPPKSSIPKRLS